MDRELQPAMKLTISIGGDERRAHHPLYQAVIDVLHESGIEGATLTRGVMSYGYRRRIHSTMNEVTMENLPIIVEAVGERESIEAAASRIADMLGCHGLVQLQTTMMIRPSKERSEG